MFPSLHLFITNTIAFLLCLNKYPLLNLLHNTGSIISISGEKIVTVEKVLLLMPKLRENCN